MAREKRAKSRPEPTGDAAGPPLPPGVKLLRTLEGHKDWVSSVTFDPQGDRKSTRLNSSH